jgi:hypothetical protein
LRTISTISLKLIISLSLMAPTTGTADNCDLALDACKEYAIVLEQEKSVLQKYADELKKQRDASYEREVAALRSQPILPWWAYVGLGALAGITVGVVLSK